VIAKIKFCGIMQGRDAACAAQCGASYLGVVFAEGPRTITEHRAREVVAAAAGVPVLGVFADQSPDDILRIVEVCDLRGVQLHGSYSAADAVRLRTQGLEIWRVVRIAVPTDLDLVDNADLGSDAVLVEPRVPQALGGSGVSLDLALACEARRRLAGHRMVLAGGLRADNVGRALAQVQPDIVDVSSGVERSAGIKDPDQITRFVEAVLAHSSVA
jgi:phosphoribosylanthranilate isomerase